MVSEAPSYFLADVSILFSFLFICYSLSFNPDCHLSRSMSYSHNSHALLAKPLVVGEISVSVKLNCNQGFRANY